MTTPRYVLVLPVAAALLALALPGAAQAAEATVLRDGGAGSRAAEATVFRTRGATDDAATVFGTKTTAGGGGTGTGTTTGIGAVTNGLPSSCKQAGGTLSLGAMKGAANGALTGGKPYPG
jgi:hypothetical protein